MKKIIIDSVCRGIIAWFLFFVGIPVLVKRPLPSDDFWRYTCVCALLMVALFLFRIIWFKKKGKDIFE